jgi:hypothetical protein
MTEQHGVYRTYQSGCRCAECRTANAAKSREQRRRRGMLRALPLTEVDIENLARTVVCPNCASKPGRPCRYAGLRSPNAAPQNYSHTGRLDLARSVTA